MMAGKKKGKLGQRIRRRSGHTKHHCPGAASSPLRSSQSVLAPTVSCEDGGGRSSSGSEGEDVDGGDRAEQLR